MTIPSSTEQLENGSRPTTPAGDNLLRDFALAEADAYAAMAAAASGRIAHVEELGLVMADIGSPCPFGNVAHLTRPLVAGEDVRVVEALRGFFGAVSGGPYLVFSPWPTPDFALHGLDLGGHPPMMIRPALTAADGGGSDLRIEVVRDPTQLEEFERTMVEAYPAVELAPFGSQQRLFADRLIDSNWTLYLGYDGDRVVATGGAYVTDRLVAVEMISTRSDCRGRGFGAAITLAAATTATDRPSLLIASDPGRPVYERLGYLPVLRYTLWMGGR